MRYTVIILLFFMSISCRNVHQKINQKPIARANNSYLYQEDIKDFVSGSTSKDDSINMVTNYINVWATKQLFIDQSKQNLTEAELKEFDNLVEDYKSTLYINAYKNAVINKSINMEVTDQDLETYYKENSENFNSNQELVKLRYLHLPPKYHNIIATRRQFKRFNSEDESYLLGRRLEFVVFSFADSTWVQFDQVLNKIPILKKKSRNKLLKNGQYIEVRDAAGTYLIKIKKVLKKGQVAPLEFIKPTIRQIILNKRKRELIKKIEKDITKDAIKNKQFEIYKYE